MRGRRLGVVRRQRERAELVLRPALGNRIAGRGRGRGEALEDLDQGEPARDEREKRDEGSREPQLVVEPALAVGAVDQVEQPADLLLEHLGVEREPLGEHRHELVRPLDRLDRRLELGAGRLERLRGRAVRPASLRASAS